MVMSMVGYGLNPKAKTPALLDDQAHVDSLFPPWFKSDSIPDSSGRCMKTVHYLCRVGSMKLMGTGDGRGLSGYFKKKSILASLDHLREATGADFCLVTSCNGAIRRKPVSTEVKVATAVVTGALALLSPFGGVMIIPGDETVFKSNSYLIDLSTGKIPWSKGYYKWEVQAVEVLAADQWAEKVFKKLKFKRR
jgi:hypothetical protein